MVAEDNFVDNIEGLTSPVDQGEVITPHDSTDLATKTRAVWVGGAGDVACIFETGGSPVLLQGVPAGTLLPIRVVRINLTNTTATLMVGLS